MLKWAVTKRAEPIVQFTAVLERPAAAKPAIVSRQSLIREIRENRRKSEFTKRYRNRNKENAVVASPHPMAITRNPISTTFPNRRSLVLRDVINKTPQRQSLPTTPTTTPIRKRNLPPSPLSTPPAIGPIEQSTPAQLPSGQSLAMRGLTVPDSYFGSARYLQPIPIGQPSPAKRARIEITPLSRRLGQLRFSKVTIQRHTLFSHQLIDDEDDLIDMSSKSLDNTDLDRMIDDILQSTRKCKPIPLPNFRSVPSAPNASPNGTFYSSESVSFSTRLEAIEESMIALDDIAECTIILDDPRTFEKEEVRSPPTADKSVQIDECQLRRQGGVRRKHAGRIRRTQQKTQHEFPTEQSKQLDRLMLEHPYLRKSIDLLAGMDTPKQVRWL